MTGRHRHAARLSAPELLTPRIKPVSLVEIDVDHPINSGLIEHWLIAEQQGASLLGLAGNHNAVLSGAPSWVESEDGVAISLTSSGQIGEASGIVHTGIATIAIWFTLDASGGGNISLCGFASGGSSTNAIELRIGDDVIGFDTWSFGNYGIAGALSLLDRNGPHLIVAEFHDSDWASNRLWIDGVEQSLSVLVSGMTNRALDPHLGIGYNGHYTSGNWRGTIIDVRPYNRALSQAEIEQIYDHPYSTLRPVSRARIAPTQSPSLDVPLAGITATLSTTTGTLSASLPLNGNSASVSDNNGQLSAGVSISGVAIADALTAAALSSGVNLNVATISEAINSGALSLTVSLDGASLADAINNGTLSIDTGGIALSGTSAAVANNSGDINLAMPLTGATLSASGGSGQLGAVVPLGGSSAAVNSNSGALDITFPLSLSGGSNAEAMASGLITLKASIGGASIAGAAASGTLTTNNNQEFINMRKLFLLREHLLNFPGKHKLQPDHLDIFADDGRIESYRGNAQDNAHYMWQYDANIIVKNFSGNTDQLFYYLLLWLHDHQPDTIAEEAIQFEADILNDKSADVSLLIKLSEVVKVEATEAGIVLTNVTEPDMRTTLLTGPSLTITPALN